MNYIEGKVSFCVLGYNHAKFAKECIESILNIDYQNKEIIFLDDGSSDDTKSVINDLKNKSTCEFVSIFQKNTGKISLNSNRLLKKCTGEYVVILSLDDVLKTDNFLYFFRCIQSNSNCAFVCSPCFDQINDKSEKINKDKIYCFTLNDFDKKYNSFSSIKIDDLLDLEFSKLGSFYVQNAIFRKSIIDCVNGYDEDMKGEDLILRTKIFKAVKSSPSLTFSVVDKDLFMYRRHSNNMTNCTNRIISIYKEYFCRYWKNKGYPPLFIEYIKNSISEMNKSDIELFCSDENLSLYSIYEVKKCIVKKYKKLKKPTLFKRIFSIDKVGSAVFLSILGRFIFLL